MNYQYEVENKLKELKDQKAEIFEQMSLLQAKVTTRSSAETIARDIDELSLVLSNICKLEECYVKTHPNQSPTTNHMSKGNNFIPDDMPEFKTLSEKSTANTTLFVEKFERKLTAFDIPKHRWTKILLICCSDAVACWIEDNLLSLD